jgi:hypothetical protein
MLGLLSVLTMLLVASGLLHAATWADPAQQYLYVLIGLVVACAFLTARESPGGQALLAWCGPVALLSFLVVFARSLGAAGISPLVALESATSADPTAALLRFFRVVIRTANEEAAVQTRHEMFASLLVASYASLAANPRGLARRVVALTVVASAALVLVSLSRAVMLAAAIAPALMLVRYLTRGYLPVGGVLGGLAVLLASPWIIPPVWRIIESRVVDDTLSYEARLGVFGELSAGDVFRRLAVGGGDFGVSTHTMVLDAFLLGGVVAGGTALAIVFMFASLGARAAALYLRTGGIAELAAVGCIALVLVRAFTAGGGLLHLVEWAGLGVAVAVLLAAQPKAERPPVSGRPGDERGSSPAGDRGQGSSIGVGERRSTERARAAGD